MSLRESADEALTKQSLAFWLNYEIAALHFVPLAMTKTIIQRSQI